MGIQISFQMKTRKLSSSLIALIRKDNEWPCPQMVVIGQRAKGLDARPGYNFYKAGLWRVTWK